MASKAAGRYEASLRAAPFSLTRVLENLRSGGIGGDARDMIEAADGQVEAANRVALGWSSFARDLQVAGSGGYLVGTATAAAHAALQPISALVSAGIRVFAGLSQHLALPKIATTTSTYWLSSESATLTPSQPTVQQVVLTPKNGGAYVAYSRQLAVQSEAEATLREDLLATAATMLDAAGLGGDGAAGEPVGLVNHGGINTVSGTGLALAGIVEMKRKILAAGARRVVWLADPLTYELLAKREAATGNGGFLIANGLIDGDRLIVSQSVPASTLIAFDPQQYVMGLWGSGPVVETNPYASFAAQGLAARVLVACDFASLAPATIAVASSVT